MSTTTTDQTRGLSQAIVAPLEDGTIWTIEKAYDYCERLARSHYENFPVGSVLIPKHLRKHFYSIYAFARAADDFADEGYDEAYPESERLRLLESWRKMLGDCLLNKAEHPVFVALAQTIAEFELPASLFEDLISAFAQDVKLRRYAAFELLVDYCRRSANPIGRLILLLFGYRDEQLHLWSDDICTALQLANHWQDVAVDLDKDRIYLPAEDQASFGISTEDLFSRRATDNFKRLMAFEVDRAEAMFRRGKPLCTSVNGRLGLELRSVWLGGTRILNRIVAIDYDVFNRRPVITSSDKLLILLGASSKTLFRRY
jgi:hydroxysqualene synthase